MKNRIPIRFLPAAFLLVAVASTSASEFPGKLEDGFRNPPQEARPQTWWHWMNGNITKEGITADLEAMKQIGLGGAQIFSVDGGIPVGPVKLLSPQWLEMVKHAAQEADRLGLELAAHNCPGWSSSGGPWNTPEHGMQEVVTSEQRVQGPAKFEAILPQPPMKLGFYRDIAVLAFRTPPDDTVQMKNFGPKLTVGQADAKAADKTSPEQSQFIQIEFAQPYRARQLMINLGLGAPGGSGRLEASDDGQTFRSVRGFGLPGGGRKETKLVCVFAPVSAKFYRIWLGSGNAKAMKKITLDSVDLSPRLGIDNFFGKIFESRSGDYQFRDLKAAPDGAVARDGLVDLTGKMSVDGKLEWDVPAGSWTILRVGYTPNGTTNHPTPEGGEGLECDKLSPEAVDAHWAGMMVKIIGALGPELAKKVLKSVVIDSYEVGSQNWTPKFREEFQKRRGYDLLRFLPVFSGRVVDSPEITERFLWDFRRTIADLFTENYAGHMAALAHQNGMKLAIEPYGNSPSDDLDYAAVGDIPMSEFWAHNGLTGCTKLAASIAHTNGRKIIDAEAFTAGEKGGNKWETDLYALKAVGDSIYCGGVNRFVLHTYTHQPWLDRQPGMTMGACGTHFDRTNTLWRQSGAWVDYLKRCQWMLQQGLFVADVCYYAGEDVPTSMYGGNLRVAGLPPGYTFDGCSTDVLLHRMSVKDGRIVLPDGMSYRVLALARQAAMRPEVLQKIKELAQAGATIIGARPAKAPGLGDYLQCDAEVTRLVTGIWGKDAKAGQSVKDIPAAEALAALGVKPDFEFAGKDANLVYIHRVGGGADVYFVSNQKPENQEVRCTFRVSGKAPELWHPDTGVIEPAPVYTEADGRVSVPLRFDPAGSVFVVFRQPTSGDHLVAVESDFADSSPAYEWAALAGGGFELQAWKAQTLQLKTTAGKTRKVEVARVVPPIELAGPWAVAFPPNRGAPASVTLDKLISWTDHPDSGVKYFSGTATYRKDFDVPADRLGAGQALYLDLGLVKNIAEVKLNGRDLGTLWKPPFRVEITGLSRAGKNQLEVRLTNLWANRLIGDEQLPPDCRWVGTRLAGWPDWLVENKPSPTGRIAFTTRHHWMKDDALLPSGLLGPVTLRSAQRITFNQPTP